MPGSGALEVPASVVITPRDQGDRNSETVSDCQSDAPGTLSDDVSLQTNPRYIQPGYKVSQHQLFSE